MSLDEQIESEKPITAIITYNGAKGYSFGLYEGKERDIVILDGRAGLEETVYLRRGIEGKVSQRKEVKAGELMGRMDEIFVYYGTGGLGKIVDKVIRDNYELPRDLESSVSLLESLKRCIGVSDSRLPELVAQYKEEGGEELSERFGGSFVRNIENYIRIFERCESLQAKIKSTKKVKLAIVSCNCHKESKQRFAESYGLPLIWTGCGGEGFFGQLMKRVDEEGRTFESLVKEYAPES